MRVKNVRGRMNDASDCYNRQDFVSTVVSIDEIAFTCNLAREFVGEGLLVWML